MKKCFLLLLCAALAFSIGCRARIGVYDIDGIVRIGFKDIDPVCDQADLIAAGESLIQTLDGQNELLLCFMIDSSISISKEELGDFDHLVIVNQAWMNRFAKNAAFRTCRPEELTDRMHSLIQGQLQMWCKDSAAARQIQIGTCEGEPFLALPFGVGVADRAIEAKRPLLLLVDSASSALKWSSFLGPVASSWNLIFTNEAHLQELLQKSPLLPYINELEPFSLDIQ